MAAAKTNPDCVLPKDAAGQWSDEPSDRNKLNHTGDMDTSDIQVRVSEDQDQADQKPRSPEGGDEQTLKKGGKSNSMRLQTSKSGIQTVSVSDMFEGWPKELVQSLDENCDGVITWDEIMHSVTKRIDAQGQATRMRRIVVVLVVAVCLTVALNSVATIVSVKMMKESHVTNQHLVDPSGQKVRVASSDMSVTADGQLCPLNDAGECVSDVVKTGEALSYVDLFDLPLLDSISLASLREVIVLLQGGKELTLSIIGSMRHESGESGTFYAASGNKIVVNSTSMKAFAAVEGQHYTISEPEDRLRRLQDGRQQEPQIYNEQDFFTVENDADAFLDSNKSRRLLLRKPGFSLGLCKTSRQNIRFVW